MVYGEDPSEGYVRGRRFLHPKLGFTFLAPPGFTLDNTAQAVLGLKDGGGEAMRLDVVSVPAEQTLPDYLGRAGWRMSTRRARGNSPSTAFRRRPRRPRRAMAFRLYAVRFGSDVYRFIFAAKKMTPAIDRAFRESIASFRRMSLKESQAVRPLRLKIVKVGRRHGGEPGPPHGGVGSPARALPRAQRARPHDRLKAGEEVKIVAVSRHPSLFMSGIVAALRPLNPATTGRRQITPPRPRH